MSAKAVRRKPIGELLVEQDCVLPEHVQEALEFQKREGGKTVDILIRLGHLDVGRFARFVSKQKGIASIQLSNYQVNEEMCSLIDRDYAVKNEVFPIDRMGKLLTVGMAFPLDSDIMKELETMTGLRVKALLCSREDILSAVKQYYPAEEEKGDAAEATEKQIESTVKLASVAELVRELNDLPTLPQTINKVQEANANPEISLKEVAEIIALDPPIAGKMLQLANSAAYGFPNKIDDVERATTLLGLDETYSIALSAAVVDLVEKSKQFNFDFFWKRSIFAAVVAKHLAKMAGHSRSPGVFSAALLHDIGSFALFQVVPGRYAKLDSGLKGSALISAEEQILGIAHPEAGYLLATHWDLPSDIAEAIRFHHSPQLSKDGREMAYLVALAAAMAEQCDTEGIDAEGLYRTCERIAVPMGLTDEDLFQIYSEALAQTRQ